MSLYRRNAGGVLHRKRSLLFSREVDSARALIARGWGVSLVSRCLRVSRAQLHVILRRTDDRKDGRRSRHSDDTDVLLRIHHVIGELPTYGYLILPANSGHTTK